MSTVAEKIQELIKIKNEILSTSKYKFGDIIEGNDPFDDIIKLGAVYEILIDEECKKIYYRCVFLERTFGGIMPCKNSFFCINENEVENMYTLIDGKLLRSGR